MEPNKDYGVKILMYVPEYFTGQHQVICSATTIEEEPPITLDVKDTFSILVMPPLEKYENIILLLLILVMALSVFIIVIVVKKVGKIWRKKRRKEE